MRRLSGQERCQVRARHHYEGILRKIEYKDKIYEAKLVDATRAINDHVDKVKKTIEIIRATFPRRLETVQEYFSIGTVFGFNQNEIKETLQGSYRDCLERKLGICYNWDLVELTEEEEKACELISSEIYENLIFVFEAIDVISNGRDLLFCLDELKGIADQEETYVGKVEIIFDYFCFSDDICTHDISIMKSVLEDECNLSADDVEEIVWGGYLNYLMRKLRPAIFEEQTYQ